MSSRPSFDAMFLEMAHVVSQRSTCKRLKVGSVLVSHDNQRVAIGYNGAPSGLPHCIEEGCLLNEQGRCIRCVHAEVNSLLSAREVDRVNSTVYVTHQPCERCLTLLIQGKVRRVVYSKEYTPTCPETRDAMSYLSQFIQMDIIPPDV